VLNSGDKDFGEHETSWIASTEQQLVDVCGNGACKRLSDHETVHKQPRSKTPQQPPPQQPPPQQPPPQQPPPQQPQPHSLYGRLVQRADEGLGLLDEDIYQILGQRLVDESKLTVHARNRAAATVAVSDAEPVAAFSCNEVDFEAEYLVFGNFESGTQKGNDVRWVPESELMLTCGLRTDLFLRDYHRRASAALNTSAAQQIDRCTDIIAEGFAFLDSAAAAAAAAPAAAAAAPSPAALAAALAAPAAAALAAAAPAAVADRSYIGKGRGSSSKGRSSSGKGRSSGGKGHSKGRGGSSSSSIMQGINDESSGDGSEDGDPALVSMRRAGEARCAASAAVDRDAWLIGGGASDTAGGSPSCKRATGNQDAPGSGSSQGSAKTRKSGPR